MLKMMEKQRSALYPLVVMGHVANILVLTQPGSLIEMTEDSSNYSLPRLNTRVGERAFSYAGPAAWNQLPESIRQLQTRPTSFKHKLKTFLFTQCYNSAD